jgi:hypothetical protein
MAIISPEQGEGKGRTAMKVRDVMIHEVVVKGPTQPAAAKGRAKRQLKQAS